MIKGIRTAHTSIGLVHEINEIENKSMKHRRFLRKILIQNSLPDSGNSIEAESESAREQQKQVERQLG